MASTYVPSIQELVRELALTQERSKVAKSMRRLRRDDVRRTKMNLRDAEMVIKEYELQMKAIARQLQILTNP